ncbi:hypothetical protein SAMN05660772_02791 [Pasteurella testudinis DSM 23072]|uniref:Anti-CBASS protein Acb1-like N-terminal domain-containing protein n=1 Tax=Pasteurella testudinis DSM 23072 TaxID=1122938 RepID=A0A1W1V3J4_9PAST|nr:anti-CBASS Acb1 family protein [Pasteurella testudinis]SMB87977.1 hypothetical protein SAMN05660772_02791 [Pasteurella testudinis DSM 23072]SUB51627.1 phage-associated protein, HI1409 family [Pasteurella testudinis]
MEQTIEINQLAEIMVNSAMGDNRAKYLSGLGVIDGNTKRVKLYDEFGYPKDLAFDHYYKAYNRIAPAYAAVHRVLDKCWSDLPVIIDGEKDEEAKTTSQWEQSVTKLLKKHIGKIKDADRRNLIGNYSALILQLRDGKQWQEPVDDLSLKTLKENGLVKLIPAWQKQLIPIEWQTDETAEDYGEPIFYQFNESEVGNDNKQRSVKIHKSRIIIFSEGTEDSDPNSGVSLLNSGYNKLLDLEKVSGGSAEGFLKNASRQLGINFSKETNIQHIIDAAKEKGYSGLAEALNAQLKKLNSGTDSALVMQEGQASVLSVAPADPVPSWTVAANEFAASVQIPFTILFGQQTGRLASDEDKADWANRCNARRNGFLSDVIVELLNRLVQFGIVDKPQSSEITVMWSDLLAPSEKEKIANAKELATVAESTLRAYGVAAVEPNEIRAAMELEPLSEQDLVPPEIGEKEAEDDEEESKSKSDITAQ